MPSAAIRAYERSDLPLIERVTSLARRFPALKQAAGVVDWDPSALHRWTMGQEAGGAAYHAGHFILNLAAFEGCQRFDVVAAAEVWGEGDRRAFVNWMRVWKF